MRKPRAERVADLEREQERALKAAITWNTHLLAELTPGGLERTDWPEVTPDIERVKRTGKILRELLAVAD